MKNVSPTAIAGSSPACGRMISRPGNELEIYSIIASSVMRIPLSIKLGCCHRVYTWTNAMRRMTDCRNFVIQSAINCRRYAGNLPHPLELARPSAAGDGIYIPNETGFYDRTIGD